jgi:hypothetical protein
MHDWVDFIKRGKNGVEIGSCWRAVFFNLAKNNQDWERILETLGDALTQINL